MIIHRFSILLLLSFLPLVYNRVVVNIPGTLQVTRNTVVGSSFNFPENYTISFDYLQTGTRSTVSNLFWVGDTSNNAFFSTSINANSYRGVASACDSSCTSVNLAADVPQNTWTPIKIVAFGTVVQTFVGASYTAFFRNGARRAGIAQLWISHHSADAAPGSIRNLTISVATSLDLSPFFLTNERGISYDNYIGRFDIPNNYAISFEIKPSANQPNWAGILRLTKSYLEDYHMARLPFLMFWPNSMRLHIPFNGRQHNNWYFGDPVTQLTLHEWNTVNVTIFQDVVQVTINGIIQDAHYTDTRHTGIASLFASDPNYIHLTAAARLRNIRIREANAKDPRYLCPARPAFRQWIWGVLDVSANYVLTFDFMPTTYLPGDASLIRFIKTSVADDQNGSNMPHLFIHGSTSRLGFDFDSNIASSSANEVLSSYTTMTLNEWHRVRLVVYGESIQLTINDVFQDSAFITGPHTGQARLYAPFGPAFQATPYPNVPGAPIGNVRNIEFKTATARDPRPRNSMRPDGHIWYYGKHTLPVNYELTFNFIHSGSTGVLFHGNRFGDMQSGTTGYRSPLISIVQGNQLEFRFSTTATSNFVITPTETISRNAFMSVKVVVSGSSYQIFYRNALVASATNAESRESYPVRFFSPSPWESSSTASFGSLEIINLDNGQSIFASDVSTIEHVEWLNQVPCRELFDWPINTGLDLPNIAAQSSIPDFSKLPRLQLEPERQLTQNWAYGFVNVPEHYNLTFEIRPNSVAQDTRNIIHFKQVGTSMGTPGFDMPSVHLVASNKIQVNFGTTTATAQIFTHQTAVGIDNFTKIQVIAFGNKALVLVNGVSEVYQLTQSRVSGECILYAASDVYPAASTLIRNIEWSDMVNIARDLAAERLLTRGWYYGRMDVPRDYALTFRIRPLGIRPSWSNIMHFSLSNQNHGTPGDRMPGIWFYGKSTRLYIVLGGNTASTMNFNLSPPQSLPRNRWTTVKILTFGRLVQVFYDDTLVAYRVSVTRMAGNAHFYVSDPWYDAANAMICNITLTPATGPDPRAFANERYLSRTWYNGELDLPLDHSISFRIRPTERHNMWTSVLHLSGTDTNFGAVRSRMPAFLFPPSSTQFQIVLGGVTNPNWYFNIPVSLPLRVWTSVKLVSVGTRSRLYLNSTSFEVTMTEARPSGRVHVYAGSPWMDSARAFVRQIQITPASDNDIQALQVPANHVQTPVNDNFGLTAQTNDEPVSTDVQVSMNNPEALIVERTLTSGWLYGEVEFPANYYLSFDFRPTSSVTGTTNILQATKDIPRDEEMLSIFFLPDNLLRIQIGGITGSNPAITLATPLSLTAFNRIVITAHRQVLQVSINGAVEDFLLQDPLPKGYMNLYLSGPSFSAAPGSIKNIEIVEAFDREVRPLDTARTLTKSWYHGPIYVPEHYHLEFWLNPTATSPVLTNVLHFTQKKQNLDTPGSRMPAIYLLPNSYQLRVEVGGRVNGDLGFNITDLLVPGSENRINLFAYGNVIVVSVNGYESSFTTRELRFYGWAHLWVSNPWNAPALATISKITLTPMRNSAPGGSPVAPGSFPIPPETGVESRIISIRNEFSPRTSWVANYGIVDVPPNYMLSFNITPTAIYNGTWGTILHFTREARRYGLPGSRMPALFFKKGTTQLRVEVGGVKNANQGFDLITLPVNQTTRFRMICVGDRLQVQINDSSIDYILFEGRHYGQAHLFFGATWSPPALAKINDFTFSSIASFLPRDLIAERTISKQWLFGQIHVPENYTLSFNLTPTGRVNDWSNILHFTEESRNYNGPGSRMPAIYFKRNSTQLRIEIGGISRKSANSGWEFPELPLSQRTQIRINCHGQKILIQINDTVYSYFSATPRPSGLAYLYVSNPWVEAAIGRISDIRLTASTSVAFPDLSATRQIQTGWYYGMVDVPADYVLSFHLTLLSIPRTLVSVLQYTETEFYSSEPGSRMPGIFILKDSRRLRIEVGGDLSFNIAHETPELPLGQTTRIRIVTKGYRTQIQLNDTTYDYFTTEDRIFGPAHLFIGNPWMFPANATISHISMTSAESEVIIRDLISPRLLTRAWYYGLWNVSENYALSFTLRPLRVVSGWGNILHFTRENRNSNQPGSRMPSIYFKPNTTQLRFEVGSDIRANLGFEFPSNLTLNEDANILLRTFGPHIFISVNGQEIEFFNPETREFGEALLYVSDPWVPAADAIISNIQMNTLAGFEPKSLTTERRLTSPCYMGMMEIPENYDLTFKIKPLGTVASMSNILHFTREARFYTDLDSRMPAIYFVAGSLRWILDLGFVRQGLRFQFPPLPMNAYSTIRIITFGREVRVQVNDTNTDILLNVAKPMGWAHLFVGSPFKPAANAMIRDISLTPFQPYAALDLAGERPLLKSWYHSMVRMPKDYSITFWLSPFNKVATLSNILHLTKEDRPVDYNTPGSRMPAVYFKPDSTQLRVEVGGNVTAALGFDVPGNLVMNQATQVTISAIGDQLTITVGSTAHKFVCTEPRPTGWAHLLVANRWNPAAAANIRNIQITDLSSSVPVLILQ